MRANPKVFIHLVEPARQLLEVPCDATLELFGVFRNHDWIHIAKASRGLREAFPLLGDHLLQHRAMDLDRVRGPSESENERQKFLA